MSTMTSTTKKPTVLVIFGISGDLAQRKLLPALANMHAFGELPDKIIGISRKPISSDALLQQQTPAVRETLTKVITTFQMDLEEQSDYERLSRAVHRHAPADSQILFYLSVPPQATLPIIASLGKAKLNQLNVKLLLEKPFGVDLPSAEETIAEITAYFNEDQIYRIDHYIAKEMTQNIIIFRNKNALFRSLWSKQFIESIEIVASETIGIEGRAGFYEQTGAMRDVLQGHLMQLLGLVLMQLPSNDDDVPQQRLKALQQLVPIPPDQLKSTVIRGQYDGYQQEVKNPGSQTETFVAVTLYSHDPTWSNVPLTLTTGKKMAQKTTEIRIHFKKAHQAEANLLTLRIQPNEGVHFELWAKKPGHSNQLQPVDLSFNYAAQSDQLAEAYERVLLDAMYSKKSLFTSSEEVLVSWRLLQPLLDHWAFYPDTIVTYPAGTPYQSLLASNAE